MAKPIDSLSWYEKAAGKRPRKPQKPQRVREEHVSSERSRVPVRAKPVKPVRESGTVRPVALERTPLFAPGALPADSRDIIEHFNEVIASVQSLSAKHWVQLPASIKQLSHELTNERPSRRLGYMNEKSVVSAYISYFMWWNLVRLSRLFAALPASAFPLTDGDAVLDVGSGPLTVPIALWLSRPELREKHLTVYCVDTSQNALSSGEELFLAVAARTAAKAAGAEPAQPWKIVRVRGTLGENVQIREKAALITCANVFNEIIQGADMPPDYLAKKYTRELLQYLPKSEEAASSLLLIEPGDPKSARFISLMRDALIRNGYAPVAPCTHSGECPMAGRRVDKNGRLSGKWCNFAFTTDDAPAALQKISEKAGLSKDRATLSFVLCSNGAALQNRVEQEKAVWKKANVPVRITSDVIHLPELHTAGYYACSERGLLLLLDHKHDSPQSGDLVTVRTPRDDAAVDKKSGAVIAELA